MGLIKDTIIAEIVERFEAVKKLGHTDSQSYNVVAREMGIDAASVRHHVKALRSTVQLAKRKLLSKASAMVDRIVEKAPTSELIDILSRPNIGVLEPAQKNNNSGGGFFLSVEVGSLGGVRATAAMLPDAQVPAALPPAPADVIDVTGEGYAQDDHVPTTAEALRYRLALARAETGSEAVDLDTPAPEESHPEPEGGPGPRSRTPWLEGGDSGHV